MVTLAKHKAFELGAVDYLLKPFGIGRLSAALDRVRGRADDRVALATRVASVVDDGRPLTRLFVRERSVIVPLVVSNIVRMEADGDYTAIIAGGRRFLVALSLRSLFERIRRQEFVRVHRQHVINMTPVARIIRYDAARLQVELKGGGLVVASRTGSQELRKFLL